LRHATLTVLAVLFLSSVAACSLSKSTKTTNQPAPANSPQVSSGHASDAAPVASESTTSSAESTPKNSDLKDELHTPEKGTEERQAIMDALRGNQDVIFQVNYLKVHNGWAWADTTPLDSKGRATAEGGANLLHFENGRWKMMNLSKVPEDPDDPMGPEDPSPTYIKNVTKTFPGVPRDIFPKPSS
jgi:hypothetical protein